MGAGRPRPAPPCPPAPGAPPPRFALRGARSHAQVGGRERLNVVECGRRQTTTSPTRNCDKHETMAMGPPELIMRGAGTAKGGIMTGLAMRCQRRWGRLMMTATPNQLYSSIALHAGRTGGGGAFFLTADNFFLPCPMCVQQLLSAFRFRVQYNSDNTLHIMT